MALVLVVELGVEKILRRMMNQKAASAKQYIVSFEVDDNFFLSFDELCCATSNSFYGALDGNFIW